MGSSDSLIGKLEDVAAPLVKFDAFPKIPKAYKARSESRGFLTVFIALAAFFLLLGDVAEYIWGWADYEFSVDSDPNPYLSINLDMAINMPCKCECCLCVCAEGDFEYRLRFFRFVGRPEGCGW